MGYRYIGWGHLYLNWFLNMRSSRPSGCHVLKNTMSDVDVRGVLRNRAILQQPVLSEKATAHGKISGHPNVENLLVNINLHFTYRITPFDVKEAKPRGRHGTVVPISVFNMDDYESAVEYAAGTGRGRD